MVTTSTPTIREIMPDNYTTRIADLLQAEGKQAPYASNLSDIVNRERITSKYWPYIERLAKEKDPEGYAARMAELREARGMDTDKAA